MKFKTLDDFDFKGKRVLLRCDLNLPVVNGKVVLNERVIESAKTIKELKKKGASVVVMAHQSRKGKSDFISLKQHAKLLNGYVKTNFVDDVFGRKATDAIEELKFGEALLLENVRFFKEEFEEGKKNKMVRNLRGFFDIFINDAFSVSHRNQTSVVSFAKILPSGVGRLMEKELNSLKKINLDSCLFILGGAKPAENISILKKAKKCLACGLFGVLVLVAEGKNFGLENKLMKKEANHIKELKRYAKRVVAPVDFAVDSGGRKELSLSEFPNDYEILDIGRGTVKNYGEKIRKAKTIFMKGPAGKFEDERFGFGTRALLKEIAKAKGESVIAGGHLTSAMRKFKISKKHYSHVSLSGGALARYVAGEKLPGLEVLKR